MNRCIMTKLLATMFVMLSLLTYGARAYAQNPDYSQYPDWAQQAFDPQGRG